MPAVLQPKPPPFSRAVETIEAPSSGRGDESRGVLTTTLLMAIAALALGGAVYLSFVGAP
ncbi:MAG: hypothetical protein R2745_07925 [Vicinamibacterales bacterium]